MRFILSLIFSFMVALQFIVSTEALARGGHEARVDRGDRGEFRGDRTNREPHRNTPHEQAHKPDTHNNDNAVHNKTNHPEGTHSTSEQNALAHEHNEHAQDFSNQHPIMNPHQGAANNAFKNVNNNWQNNASNWNRHNNWNSNSWHNTNWNNNWNYNGGQWGYGYGFGWNNSLYAGVLAGISIGMLFSTYSILNQPEYPYYGYSYPVWGP